MTVNTSVFSNDIMKTLEQLGYYIKYDASTGLTIAKTTCDVKQHHMLSDNHGRLDLKGLIVREDDDQVTLIAPGCLVPLEQANDSLSVSKYTIARDGIMYRFYYTNDAWHFSTTGCIVPNTFWGVKGVTPTFQALVQKAINAELVDYDKLNPKYCYYAILESPEFTNIIKHDTLQLTLVDIVDCSTKELRHVSLADDQGFQSHEQFFNEQPPSDASNVGFIVHYTNGSVYRHETERFKRASTIKPNVPDPAKQWVIVAQDTALERGGINVEEFLDYFPWHKEIFEICHDKFVTLIDTVYKNYKAIVAKGWHNVCVPPRHVVYMRNLMVDATSAPPPPTGFGRAPANDADLKNYIGWHLLHQEIDRLYFLINPYDVQPRTQNTMSRLSFDERHGCN